MSPKNKSTLCPVTSHNNRKHLLEVQQNWNLGFSKWCL